MAIMNLKTITLTFILGISISAHTFANNCQQCYDSCDMNFRFCEDRAMWDYTDCYLNCWDSYGGDNYWNDHGYLFDFCTAVCEMYYNEDVNVCMYFYDICIDRCDQPCGPCDDCGGNDNR